MEEIEKLKLRIKVELEGGVYPYPASDHIEYLNKLTNDKNNKSRREGLRRSR